MTSPTGSSNFILDGALMTSRDAAHAHLASVLPLPPHYGRNLDALYDSLAPGLRVTLTHPQPMLDALGQYGFRLLQTLKDALGEGFEIGE